MKTLSFIISFITIFTSFGLSQDCEISNVFAEAHPCDSLGLFLVDIEFDASEIGNMGFEIRGNGQSYGFYEYGQNFYTIGPLQADCTTLYEFVIIDVNDDGCNSFYEFDEPICCTDECIIYNINIDSTTCNPDGTYNFELNFNHLNSTNQFFDVFADTTFIGYFNYDSLPVQIENFIPRNVDYDLIKICDNDNPDCCLVHEFMGPDCEPQACDIRDLELEFSICNAEYYFIYFSFISENTSTEGFTVAGNGIIHAQFEYGMDSYSLGPFLACNELNELVIIDNQYENCSTAIEFEAPDCCIPIGGCHLAELFAETYCDGDSVYIDFEFVAQNTGNEGFTARGNGVTYGSFEYNHQAPFYTIGPLDNCEIDELILIDNEVENCSVFIDLEAPECCSVDEDCNLSELFVETYCDGDSIYIDFEFLAENPGNNGFTARGNGIVYGSFEYGATSYSIGPLINCDFDELVLIDNDSEACNITILIFTPGCCNMQNDCELWGLNAEPYCDGEAVYVDFEFNSANTGNSGFTVRGNGTEYGSFDYGQTFYTIGPLDNCEFGELIIIDNQFENCNIAIGIEPPECCNNQNDCELWDFVAETICDGEAVYVDFEFNSANTGNNGFTARGNGNEYGSFDYGQNSYTIGPLANCDFDELVIIDNQFENCNIAIDIESPECCNNQNDCELWEFISETICDGDAVYIEFEFNSANTGNNGFTVRGNGNEYGSFDYGQNSYTIGPLENCDFDELVIIDNQFENCNIAIDIESPECCNNQNDCELWDFIAETTCDGEAVYVEFEFNSANTGNNGFTVRGNGTEYGNFDYGQNSYTIGPLANCDFDELVIIDNQFEACNIAIGIDPPECCNNQNDCALTGLEILDFECHNDGSLWVSIDFEQVNTENIGFDLFINDVFHSFHNYNSSAYDFELLEGVKDEPFIITVCDNDNSNCCSEIEFLLPISDCEIENLIVTPTECIDGEYFLILDFEHSLSGSEANFTINNNGLNLGNHLLSDLPLALGPIQAAGEVNLSVIEVLIEEFEECAATTEVEIVCDVTSNIDFLTDNQWYIIATENNLEIYKESTHPCTAHLINVDGRLIDKLEFKESGIFNAKRLPTGIYIIQLTERNHRYSKKIFIE